MRKALLIAGAGTLGGAVYPELLRLGWAVDVVSLEDFRSVMPQLRFVRADANRATLERLLAETPHYDAIVDFLHVADSGEMCRRIDLCAGHTDQFVFVSSSRAYADAGGLVTERTPLWIDVTEDADFLARDVYALPKCRGERHVRGMAAKNWTIVRPQISFSHYRLDLVSVGAYALLTRGRAGKPIPLPVEVRDKLAGIGWAGNVGRELAALLGNPRALGEDFTLGTGEAITWGGVAACYEEFAGCRFAWIPAEDYLRIATPGDFDSRQIIYTDRILDRRADVAKVLDATGIAPGSFVDCRSAVAHELAFLSERPDLVRRFDVPLRHELDARMDAYFAR
ncbi:MAG: hypothetical protein ACI4RD_00985 [Kiritimatiellia bacterium]